MEETELSKDVQKQKLKSELIRLLSIELSKPSNLQDKLNSILLLLDQNFNLKHTLLLLPDEQQTVLRVSASRGFTESGIGVEVKFGEGQVGLVAAKKRKLRLVNISRKKFYMRNSESSALQTYNPLPSLACVESLVVLPIISGEELVAVLSSESEDINFFSQEDEDFLMTLSQLIGLSIQNSLIIDRLEQKVQQRTEALEDQKLALQKANASKDRLFAIIGHDLRSPAAALQNVAELIDYYQKKGDSNYLFELGNKIVKSAKNMNTILDNLLSWSITQTGEIRMQPEVLKLSPLLDELMEVFADTVASKEITVTITCEEGISLYADKNSVMAIFRNLMSNALKFTNVKGTIDISAKNNNEIVTIMFKDNGIGIDTKKLPELFMIMENKSTPGTSKEKGIGLGLIIVNDLMRLNKGSVSVSSKQGEGTSISVHFPLAG